MVEKLYEQYYSELLRWCRNMTQDDARAEDLVQEAFYRALRHEEVSGMDEMQGRAWLYRTIRNLFIDGKRHEKYEIVAEVMKEEEKPETGYALFENEEFLSVLSGEEKKLFVMRYLEGYNSNELGKIFAMPPATVRLRLTTARTRLRRELEE